MIEKLKEDKKYRAKIELIGYGIFILIAIMFAISGRNNANTNSSNNNYNDIIENTNTTTNVINLFDKYSYSTKVEINENIYEFNGEYSNNILIINKDNIKYAYKDNNYYMVDTNEIVNEDIYAPVESKYLSIDLINKYIKISKYMDNEYRVYLKDIIIGNDSDNYITIVYSSNLNEININIDYTNLLKCFDNTINKYLVIMKYTKVID